MIGPNWRQSAPGSGGGGSRYRHRGESRYCRRPAGGVASAEGLVPGGPEDIDHGPEGKPLGDLLATPQQAAELGARELGDLLALLLGHALLDIALLGANVDHVLVVRDRDAQLRGVLLARLLRVVGPVEVLARDGALRARHVAADDEVGGAVVLPDDHVLDGLAGARHLHAVGQVGPAEHGVLLLRLLAERLVGLDAHEAVNVAGLCGAAGGVHQQHRVLDVALGALQELEVCPVDGVPVLEGHDILARRQHLAHLRRRLHRVREGRAREAMKPAADVIGALLGHEGVDGGVLEAGGAEGLLGLQHLVRLPDGGGLEHRDVLAAPAEQQLVALLEARDVRQVKGHGQTEELLLRQSHAPHYSLIGRLLHEAGERAEGAVQQAKDVASLALVQLHGLRGAGLQHLGFR
mmetsp:Transcript_26259/g.40448  ORF Transcript_26259/g.40448 Transcript_26259/m.40448 type:complete len:407 (-) Transcript_26259:108-1328(-)